MESLIVLNHNDKESAVAFFFFFNVVAVNGELELVTVGQAHTDQSQGFTYSPGEDNNTIWEETGGIVPQDGTPKTVVNVPLLPLMVLLYIYATAGIIFAIACLIINIIFREKRYTTDIQQF